MALLGVGSGPTGVSSGSPEALRAMHNRVDESAFFWEGSEFSPLTPKGSQREEGEDLAQRGPTRGLASGRGPGCPGAPRLPWAYRTPSSKCHQRCRARLGVGTVVGAATAGHAASGACGAHDGAAAVRLSAAVPTGRATWRLAAPPAIKGKKDSLKPESPPPSSRSPAKGRRGASGSQRQPTTRKQRPPPPSLPSPSGEISPQSSSWD